MEIVKATINDLDELQGIGIETFSETFSKNNTKENMEKYLLESFSTEKLAAELNDANAEFYFATQNEKVIGYLKINFGAAQTELKDSSGLEIERIYVFKAFHGKHVGQLLYEKALEIAKQHELAFVWLGVWEENLRAISFYQKNGFVVFDKHLFKLGEEIQTDIMMRLDV